MEALVTTTRGEGPAVLSRCETAVLAVLDNAPCRGRFRGTAPSSVKARVCLLTGPLGLPSRVCTQYSEKRANCHSLGAPTSRPDLVVDVVVNEDDGDGRRDFRDGFSAACPVFRLDNVSGTRDHRITRESDATTAGIPNCAPTNTTSR